MNSILNSFFQDQYKDFKNILVSQWSVDSATFSQFGRTINPIHKKYLALSCAATVIGQRSHRNEYAEGITESSFFALVLAIKGLENPASVLLRQNIEMCLKHIYFYSHPVEYNWAATRDAYKELNFQMLLEYLTKTDEYKNFSSRKKNYDTLSATYAILSRYVHVQSKGFLNYSKINKAYKINVNVIKKIGDYSKNIWPILITLLIIYFPSKYKKASAIEKSLIRSGLTIDLKTSIDHYLRNMQG